MCWIEGDVLQCFQEILLAVGMKEIVARLWSRIVLQ